MDTRCLTSPYCVPLPNTSGRTLFISFPNSADVMDDYCTCAVGRFFSGCATTCHSISSFSIVNDMLCVQDDGNLDRLPNIYYSHKNNYCQTSGCSTVTSFVSSVRIRSHRKCVHVAPQYKLEKCLSIEVAEQA